MGRGILFQLRSWWWYLCKIRRHYWRQPGLYLRIFYIFLMTPQIQLKNKTKNASLGRYRNIPECGFFTHFHYFHLFLSLTSVLLMRLRILGLSSVFSYCQDDSQVVIAISTFPFKLNWFSFGYLYTWPILVIYSLIPAVCHVQYIQKWMH